MISKNVQQDTQLSHDGVCFNGFLSELGIVNFLNIPYGEISERFRPAKLLHISDLPPVVDSSQYGPRCPQKEDLWGHVMGHMFEKLSAASGQDEYACLNLNIYAPPEVLKSSQGSRLPVFAWIHGGAMNVGDNTSQFGEF
jgi:carboxylesterase type B